jgi:hypothetical protein
LAAQDYKLYESKAAGLKAKVPAKWERIDNENGFLAMFVPPTQKGGDPYANYMGFFVQKLKTPVTTLEEYTALSKKEVKADVYAKLLESGSAVLAGQTGHRMTGVTQREGRPAQWTQVWTVKHETAYVCTYVAEKDLYQKFSKDFENLVASVTIA